MLSATITVLSAPVAFPDSAQAVSWQERMQEMQQRKEQVLAEAKNAASGGSDGESKSASNGNSYLDKISSELSLKIQDTPGTDSSPAPEPQQEAPKPKPEPSKPRFSFQQFDKEEQKSPPAATSKPPGDALPTPKPESAPETQDDKLSKGLPFSFSNPFGKKDESAAQPDASAPLGGPEKAAPEPSVPSPPKPEPSSPPALSFKAPERTSPKPSGDGGSAPAPAQGDSKPWWERIDEVTKSPPKSVEAVKEEAKQEAKKVELPKPDLPKPELPKLDLPKPDLPKPEPVKKAESKKEDVKADAKKAVSNPKGAEKGRKKQTNGFALFGSQMLMLGAFVGGTYALLFKGEALGGVMQKVDDAILNATDRK